MSPSSRLITVVKPLPWAIWIGGSNNSLAFFLPNVSCSAREQIMLPSLDSLVASARESVRPYRWLVKQSRCRACGEVHEQQPLLMCQAESGWSFSCEDDGSHESAPVVFEEQLLAWCQHCHSPAAAELTKRVRNALDDFSNTTELAKRLRDVLALYEREHTKEAFHHHV
jgi:hypothetical protein